MGQSVDNDFSDAFAHSGSERFRNQIRSEELRIEEEEFFPGGHLTRYRIHNNAMRGIQEIVQLAPGFSVITTSFEALQQQTTSYSGCGWIVLQCCVSGEYDIMINHGVPQRLSPGDCRLDILLQQSTWTRRQVSSARYRYVAIFLKPDELLLLLSAGQRSRNTLQDLLAENTANGVRHYTFAASRNLIAAVNEIAEFGSYGGLRPAFVKAKAIELLVFAFNSLRWNDMQCNKLQQRARLSRGARIAHRTREIIEREFAERHSVEELANRVGSNRTTLTSAFKTEYHITPMQYLQRTRLENAQEMLMRHEGTVHAIAEHVGYGDAASFIRAYRKHFGVTPGGLND